MERDFIFSSDYIEILTNTCDSIIYTPIYSENIGLCLYTEDEKPIKDITLLNSRLIINYMDGENQLIDNIVMSITIEDTYFKRRMNKSIKGTLFKYSLNDALLYELEIKNAFDYETIDPKVRKRSI